MVPNIHFCCRYPVSSWMHYIEATKTSISKQTERISGCWGLLCNLCIIYVVSYKLYEIKSLVWICKVIRHLDLFKNMPLKILSWMYCLQGYFKSALLTSKYWSEVGFSQFYPITPVIRPWPCFRLMVTPGIMTNTRPGPYIKD